MSSRKYNLRHREHALFLCAIVGSLCYVLLQTIGWTEERSTFLINSSQDYNQHPTFTKIDPNDKEALIKSGCFVDPQAYKPETKFNESLSDTAEDAWIRIFHTCSAIEPAHLKRCPIPNAFHGVMGNHMKFKFIHYVALKSVYEVMKPFAIYIHGFNFPMENKLFQKAIQDFNLILIPSRRPDMVFFNEVKNIQHQSDILRMEINILYGGIYADFDVLWLQSLQTTDLLSGKHETVLAAQTPTNRPKGWIANGVLINKRCARFMIDWYKFYVVFNDRLWDAHSVVLPHLLWKTIAKEGTRSGEVLHVELSSMQQPSYFSRELIHTKKGLVAWNWTQNIACHLWFRSYPAKKALGFGTVESFDDPVGRMVRWILSGDKREPFDMKRTYFQNETHMKINSL